ncbi:MAG: RNA polymerase sigma factor [Myxococcales bacterium]
MPTTTKAAFEQWVARVRPELVRSAAALLRDEDEAENVVQATLLTLWESDSVADVRHLDGYARRAVWLNALRWRQRRRRLVSLDGRLDEPAAAGGGLSPWELEEALAGLPPAQQTVIRLRFYGGFTFQEIGRTLSISMNTAASRCRYGLNALRLAFGGNEITKGEDE